MRSKPTPTGLAALAPAPMSQAEIADLVARVRRNTILAEQARLERTKPWWFTATTAKAAGLLRRRP